MYIQVLNETSIKGNGEKVVHGEARQATLQDVSQTEEPRQLYYIRENKKWVCSIAFSKSTHVRSALRDILAPRHAGGPRKEDMRRRIAAARLAPCQSTPAGTPIDKRGRRYLTASVETGLKGASSPRHGGYGGRASATSHST